MKKLLIIGSILLLIINTIGCEEFEGVKTVEISGIETNQTINRPGEEINLDISGIDCDITVTKDTILNKIILSGIDCVVRVSRSHSFTSDNSGVNCEILFYD